MKFYQEEEKFQPIVITLESEDEVHLLLAAISEVKVSPLVKDTNFLYNIYRNLRATVYDHKYDVRCDDVGWEIIPKQ